MPYSMTLFIQFSANLSIRLLSVFMSIVPNILHAYTASLALFHCTRPSQSNSTYSFQSLSSPIPIGPNFCLHSLFCFTLTQSVVLSCAESNLREHQPNVQCTVSYPSFIPPPPVHRYRASQVERQTKKPNSCPPRQAKPT